MRLLAFPLCRPISSSSVLQKFPPFILILRFFDRFVQGFRSVLVSARNSCNLAVGGPEVAVDP